MSIRRSNPTRALIKGLSTQLQEPIVFHRRHNARLDAPDERAASPKRQIVYCFILIFRHLRGKGARRRPAPFSLCGPYDAGPSSASKLDVIGASFPPHIEKENAMTDAIALGLGLVLLGAMALYAKALTRA
jgi:hypothetical protein